jgi:hypothetical protein
MNRNRGHIPVSYRERVSKDMINDDVGVMGGDDPDDLRVGRCIKALESQKAESRGFKERKTDLGTGMS